MKQSKLMSFAETFLSTVIGLAVALATQIVVFPLFGWSPPLATNLAITAIFTLVSIARQFVVRRLFEALHIRTPLSPAMLAVIAERRRQVEVEGWTPEHDAIEHDPETLARHGAAYLLTAGGNLKAAKGLWSWDDRWFKPDADRPRRDYVRGLALGLAGLELLDRSKTKRSTS